MRTLAAAIAARAPGKVVLWGEYAVLAGAPALVMAVDRYATCRLEPVDAPGWQIRASGFQAADAAATPARLLDPEPPARDQVWAMLWQVLACLRERLRLNAGDLPDGVRASFDTGAFHLQGAKLGLGSSAALCVAMHGAVCRMLGVEPSLEAALDAHRRFQQGAGSGIDVTAAWFGGTLRFRRGDSGVAAVPWTLPESCAIGFVWTGVSARTSDHLRTLQHWLSGGEAGELEALALQAAALFESARLVEDLQDYVQALQALDAAAGLDIFSDAHRQLAQLAIDAGVVYKPCGAGGGDVGAAFARSGDAIERFNRLAAAAGFMPLALETAPHGIELTG